ncbi:OmpA family protein [Alkalihalobacterium elongatum]|uniref:OmpA family protein n=1 Tax=Alkalihalobacterium elongatum TaxID=2675466 RepID=UPI001C1FDC68|nr:OmpA family protein [Alkalihalobacterium elongatum]
MMRTLMPFHLLLVGLVLLLIVSGCNAIDEEEVMLEETTQQEGTNIDEKIEETVEEPQFTEEVKEQENVNLQIEMNANAFIEGDHIVVEGSSNIIPGAAVRLYAETIQRTITQVPLGERVTVDENGNFRAELKPGRYNNLRLIISLEANQQDDIQEHYGEFNSKLEGPLIYTEESYHGDIIKEARIETAVFLQDDVTEYSFDVPIRAEKPEDYGDTNIWIEADVTNDHRYIYVKGRSNLIEGTRLSAEYWSSERHHMSQNQIIRPYAFVNPDGSFDFMVHYNTLRKEGFLQIYTLDTERSKLTTQLINVYGEKFENIEGDYVVQRRDGSNSVELILYPETPELDVPEDISLTTDKEETMMTVSDEMLFDFDESELKSEAKEVLNSLLETLATLEAGTVVEIRGHTDSQGDPSYNLNLSKERASAVMNYILENGDTNHLEYRVEGYGETKPIASNEDEKGRAQNRRVELVINPQGV